MTIDDIYIDNSLRIKYKVIWYTSDTVTLVRLVPDATPFNVNIDFFRIHYLRLS